MQNRCLFRLWKVLGGNTQVMRWAELQREGLERDGWQGARLARSCRKRMAGRGNGRLTDLAWVFSGVPWMCWMNVSLPAECLPLPRPTPGLEASTFVEPLLQDDRFCLGASLGFRPARKIPFCFFPVEPCLPCHTADGGADPWPSGSGYALSASHTPGVPRWHRRYLLPNLLSASKSFLISLGREENSFPWSHFFIRVPMPVTLCLSTICICPLPTPPLLICSLTLLPAASPSGLSMFLFLVFSFHSTSKHLQVQERIWHLRCGWYYQYYYDYHSLYHHHSRPHFYRGEEKMMLGSCNALTQITKMLHGPAQIFDFQFSVFSQILYSSSSCYFNLLSFIELPLKFGTLKKPNKLPFSPVWEAL